MSRERHRNHRNQRVCSCSCAVNGGTYSLVSARGNIKHRALTPGENRDYCSLGVSGTAPNKESPWLVTRTNDSSRLWHQLSAARERSGPRLWSIQFRGRRERSARGLADRLRVAGGQPARRPRPGRRHCRLVESRARGFRPGFSSRVGRGAQGARYVL